MTKTDQVGESIVGAVRDLLQRTLTPLVARLKEVESRPSIDVDHMLYRVKEIIPAGERGIDGKDGKDGANGDQGDRGEKGDKGEHGEKGADGIGIKGEPGNDGRDGLQGEPGRDAVHVEVLDGIDPAKRYQRGTFATHRGGLVRSFRATDPLPSDPMELGKAGWHVVLHGIADFELSVSEDQRTFKMSSCLTDGRLIERSVSVPTMIYRGVWKEGDYTSGDTVTRDGSTWIAKTSTVGIPGASEDWQLAVKKGRDGRDGLKGEKGERGAQGKDGDVKYRAA